MLGVEARTVLNQHIEVIICDNPVEKVGGRRYVAVMFYRLQRVVRHTDNVVKCGAREGSAWWELGVEGRDVNGFGVWERCD